MNAGPLNPNNDDQGNVEPTPTPLSIDAENGKTLLHWGIGLSIIYTAPLLVYIWHEWGHMLAMKPDAFGTFLSGVFAPLGFLWLVLGFKQQGDELQNSARALWLQSEELRNSVEQQRQLVEVSKEQLASEHAARVREDMEADRKSQPILIPTNGGGSYSGDHRTLIATIESMGPAVTNVSVFGDGILMHDILILEEGRKIWINKSFDSPELVNPMNIFIEYTDKRGGRRRQTFYIPLDETGGPSGDRTWGTPSQVGSVERLD